MDLYVRLELPEAATQVWKYWKLPKSARSGLKNSDIAGILLGTAQKKSPEP